MTAEVHPEGPGTPQVSSSPAMDSQVTFAIRNSAGGMGTGGGPPPPPKTELQTIQILFSMANFTETQTHGATTISFGMNSGCGKIDATLANGNEFTDIKTYMDQSLTMSMEDQSSWHHGKSMRLTTAQIDAAVMKLESDKV